MTRLASGCPWARTSSTPTRSRSAARCAAGTRCSGLSFAVMGETLVMKFGGTSVADAERIRRAAGRIVRSADEGNHVVAVLSARGKHTDELVALAHEVSDRPHPREMDMLLSTGERVSCALAAMVINDSGHEAISLTGSQAGIVTDSGHTRARILEVKAHRIRAALDSGKIVLVAGFQGVSQQSLDVTTLGRGGSDTTAVALAAALGAGVCEIYTDVLGVFSADPRIVPEAKKLPVLTFEEMLEMSASGAGVLQLARGVRPQPWRDHPLPVQLRRRTGYRGPRRGPDHGTTASHRRHPLHLGGPHHAHGSARPSRHRGPRSHRPCRRQRQRRHDHPERACERGWLGGHVGHGATGRSPSPARRSRHCPRARIPPSAADAEMGKVSLVGAGMRSHPGVAAKA